MLLTSPASLRAAAPQHLTLRLEDGIPTGRATAPVTIVVPVNDGTGGAGAATAPFYEYGPHAIDGGKLRLDGERLTGTVTGKFRTGTPMPVWTVDARIKGGRVTGTSSAPGAGRAAAVQSRVAGWVDAPTGGNWIVEVGLPWTDGGSASKLEADGSDRKVAYIIRLRFAGNTGTVVHLGNSAKDSPQLARSQQIRGTAENFTAEITGPGGESFTLRGGRLGRGGVVTASVKSERGRVKEWSGAATVWAWPDSPGFVGGPEQKLPGWKHDAEPDPALVAAAVKEAAMPIRPVAPGTGEVWHGQAMQRSPLRCTAPPAFDVRPLPAAAKYRFTVTRVFGQPLTLVDEEVTDPFAALAAAWEKRVLGKFRFEFHVAGKSVWAQEVWLREPGQHVVAFPSWLAPVLEAPSYRVRVNKEKDTGAPLEFAVQEPWQPLTAVWEKLTPAGYRIEVRGAGDRGWIAAFVKAPTFRGPYFAGPARPYAEAALRLARWTCDFPELAWFRGHDVQTSSAGDFGQCQIMYGAVSAGLVRYRLGVDEAEREAGLLLATEAGDVLRQIATGRGGIPKGYKEGIANTPYYGVLFLDLYAATNDERWRVAALMVAKGFAAIQLPYGTWAEGWQNPDIPAKMKPLVPKHTPILAAGLIPGIHGPHLHEYDCSEVLWFLGRLRQEFKTDDFRATEDKAYRWVMDNSVKTFFWRDQGHHSPCMVPPFHYKGGTANYFAAYLLESAPAERRDVKLVEELMRFCETRHMDWSRPDPATAQSVTPNLVSTSDREVGSALWLGSRFALVWERLGRETNNPLLRAKARAFMDAVTHAQHPVTGNIGTGLESEMRFNRFAINAGRGAWNLMTYGDLLAPQSAK